MIYTIKKGKHYAGFKFPKFHKDLDRLEFTVIFDKSCLYELGTIDDLDVNKIRGVSWGHHKEWSFRFGWNIDRRFEHEKIAIYTYTYNNSVRDFQYIASIDFNKPVQMEAQFDYENNVIHTFLNPGYLENHLSKRIYFKIPYQFPKFRTGYFLKTFFGGNIACPHDMKIAIFEN